MDRPPGDSAEQREAEAQLVTRLSKELGAALGPKDIPLPDGGCLQVDGASDFPSILCEAWAHQGRPRGATYKKVLADAFKLLYAAQLISKPARLILAFADQEAAAPFTGKSWMAQALRTNRIEVCVVRLPKRIHTRIRKAQVRQFR